MTPTRTPARSGSYLPYLLLFVPLLFLVWAFWPTLTEMCHTWISDPQYSHGFLVPVFSLFILWMRRDMLKQSESRPSWWEAVYWWPAKNGTVALNGGLSVQPNELRPSWWGMPVLACGIALHFYGGYYYFTWIDQVAIVPCVAGLWIMAGGRTAWRWGWPGIAFLLFMIPLPYRYATELSGPLQRIATLSSTFVMQVIGLPALSEGNVISVNDAQIGVVEACSGLRMLFVFFALSAAVVIVSRRPLLDKIIILLSAAPIAIFSNVLRVTVTGVLHQTTTSEVANTFFHDVAGLLMPALALGLLWGELKILSHLFIELPAPPPVRVKREPVGRRNAPAQRTPHQRSAGAAVVKQPQQPAETAEPVAAAKTGTES